MNYSQAHSDLAPLEVWRVKPDYRFQAINLDESRDFMKKYPRPCQGEPMIATWVNYGAHIRNPDALAGDFFPFSAGCFGLKPRAFEIMGSLLSSDGELLPVQVTDVGQCQCCIFNPTKISAEALDEERSKRRLLAGKWLMEPTKFVFNAGALRELSIFKIPEDPGSILCVRGEGRSDESDFVELYKRHELTGLFFEPLWTQVAEA